MAVSKAIDEPNASIRCLRPVRSSKLHRVYEVVLSDGRILELVMPPPSMLRLLRSERQIINAEAIVVQWLSTLLSDENRSVQPGSTREEDGGSSPSDRSDGATSRSSRTSSQRSSAEKAFFNNRPELLPLLPKLLNYSLATSELATPHSIYQPRGGTSITSLPRPLTKQERAQLDIQLGRLTRQFADIQSPSGGFGLAVSILGATKSTTSGRDGSRTSSPSSGGPMEGSPTWSTAFHVIFEGVLRDSEDMAIMLAYPVIRKHLARLSYLLDEVTTPSLVFVDSLDDDNVLVECSATEQRNTPDVDDESSGSDSSDSNEGSSEEEEEEAGELKSSSSGSRTASRQASPIADRAIRIVGLRDWSNGVFGDPLLATAFSNNPSKQLLEGFHGTNQKENLPTPNNDEHNASIRTRLLLYAAYHATVSIVTEFYRPRGEGTTRELAARRKLTEALMKLEEVDDDPKGSRHRRPSGEMSPAKKMKPGEEERPAPSRRHETTIQEV